MNFVVKVQDGYLFEALLAKVKKKVVVLSHDRHTRTIACIGNPSDLKTIQGIEPSIAD